MQYSVVQFGLMVWSDVAWHRMILYGLVWYVLHACLLACMLACYSVLVCRHVCTGACRHSVLHSVALRCLILQCHAFFPAMAYCRHVICYLVLRCSVLYAEVLCDGRLQFHVPVGHYAFAVQIVRVFLFFWIGHL